MRCTIAATSLVLATLSVPAVAVETEVLFDGTSIADWSPMRDGARIERELSLSELIAVEDPAALQWRFVSRGPAFNDIFLTKPTARPFDKLRVRVKNEGEPFALAAKVRDAGGGEWTANQIPLERGEDWRWVEFPREEWDVASWSKDPDGKLDFPLANFVMIAFGVKPGAEYHLKVARVEAVRPDPPVATIHELRLPEKLRAGQQYTAELSFTLDRPCREDDAYLLFRRGKAEMFRRQLDLPAPSKLAPGQRVTVRNIDLRVPQYALGGRCSVVLRIGEAHIEESGKLVDEEVRAVTIEQRPTGKTTAAVKEHNGTPTLFINGEPHSGAAWATYRPTVEVFRDFTEAGVNLFTFSATPTESGYGLSRTAWTAPDEYDFSQLDERVLLLLEANPDAYFFPRLYVHAPQWWSEQHPDDIVMMDPGDGNYVPFIHAGGKPAPSWASETWRKDTVEGLRRLIAHVEASPYADRIVGYHIASGTTEEWMMWGGNENQWVDYSPVNVARFREWLEAKYGTDAALREAWGDDVVSLRTAAIPPKAQREQAELGALRDPAQEQAVIDFYLYNSDLVADTICYFAQAMKGLTKREKLVGFFYGYLLQLCGEQRQQNAGHLALAKVLASSDIDFLCSPTSYAFRQVGGEGTSHFMSLLGSVKLHGKVWFNEDDIRTSLTKGEIGSWGKPATVAEDILQQEKELAHALVGGAANWWFDVGGIRFDDPALMQRIGGLTKSASETLQLDRAPADEVAMVVDEKSLCYLRVAHPLGRELLVAQLPALHRIGAPVGHYLVTDLPRIADRKVFLIMTSLAPTAQDREAIDALKGDGRTLVFCYAPGLYRDGRIDEGGMTDLTGITLRMSQEPARLRVTLRGGHRIAEGLDNVTYGVDREVAPVCCADDADAAVLGTLPDGRPGLVVKEHEDWTAIHSAAPMLPAALIRRIAQVAGVHLYIDTEDVVWAAKELVAVSVKEPGTRTIRLPGKAKVRDLYTGAEIGESLDAFEAEFADRATRVFVTQ